MSYKKRSLLDAWLVFLSVVLVWVFASPALAAGTPTITSMSPTFVVAGSSGFCLTINGTNFNAQTTFGIFSQTNLHQGCTVTGNPTSIFFWIPAAQVTLAYAGKTFPVEVSNPGFGTSSSGMRFTVNNPRPSLTAASPQAVVAGTTNLWLGISGSGFVNSTTSQSSTAASAQGGSASSVSINGNAILAASTIIRSSNTLAVNIPDSYLSIINNQNQTSYTITVSNPTPGGGVANSTASLVVLPGPKINSITANPNLIYQGVAGSVLTISGENFITGSTFLGSLGEVSTVVLTPTDGSGAITLSSGVNVVSTNQITVALPATLPAKTYAVQVQYSSGGNGYGAISAVGPGLNFTISADPHIASVADASWSAQNTLVYPGDLLTVSGTNFDAPMVSVMLLTCPAASYIKIINPSLQASSSLQITLPTDAGLYGACFLQTSSMATQSAPGAILSNAFPLPISVNVSGEPSIDYPDGVSPRSANAGQTITIQGSNFVASTNSQNVVKVTVLSLRPSALLAASNTNAWESFDLTDGEVSSSVITFIVPATLPAGLYDMQVAYAGINGQPAKVSNIFLGALTIPPAIMSDDPLILAASNQSIPGASVMPGNTLMVTGNNFNNATFQFSCDGGSSWINSGSTQITNNSAAEVGVPDSLTVAPSGTNCLMRAQVSGAATSNEFAITIFGEEQQNASQENDASSSGSSGSSTTTLTAGAQTEEIALLEEEISETKAEIEKLEAEIANYGSDSLTAPTLPANSQNSASSSPVGQSTTAPAVSSQAGASASSNVNTGTSTQSSVGLAFYSDSSGRNKISAVSGGSLAYTNMFGAVTFVCPNGTASGNTTGNSNLSTSSFQAVGIPDGISGLCSASVNGYTTSITINTSVSSLDGILKELASISDIINHLIKQNGGK